MGFHVPGGAIDGSPGFWTVNSSGHLVPRTNNVSDIGADNLVPRDVMAGRTMVAGYTAKPTGNGLGIFLDTNPVTFAYGSHGAPDGYLSMAPAGILDVGKTVYAGTDGDINCKGIKQLVGRKQEAQGADVPSANNLTLGLDGNFFRISGNVQINLLDSTGWQGGSKVWLQFLGTPTLKNNTAASGAFKPVKLDGGGDIVMTANDVLGLVYDATTSTWFQFAKIALIT